MELLLQVLEVSAQLLKCLVRKGS